MNQTNGLLSGDLKKLSLLKKILWADFALGAVVGLAGLVLYQPLTSFLGLPANLILIIAAITFLYAIVAFSLAIQRIPSAIRLKMLIYANWGWTIISIVLLILFALEATIFGVIFLVLQIVVVGVLAWLEGRLQIHLTLSSSM